MHTLAMGLGRSAMVVKELYIDENATETFQVHIRARKSGIIAFILALIGIDPTVTFDVFFNRIEFRESSLSGEICSIYPLSAISAAVTGFTKPILLIVLAVSFLLSGISYGNKLSNISSDMGTAVMVGGLVIALILVILYFLRKTLLVGAITHGGPSAILVVKSSVIEGQKVDYELAQRIIAIINRNIMQQTTR